MGGKHGGQGSADKRVRKENQKFWCFYSSVVNHHTMELYDFFTKALPSYFTCSFLCSCCKMQCGTGKQTILLSDASNSTRSMVQPQRCVASDGKFGLLTALIVVLCRPVLLPTSLAAISGFDLKVKMYPNVQIVSVTARKLARRLQESV